MELTQYPDNMVFGLDIGTRNVVGTVGYMKDENRFVVVSQSLREHTTRAMLDGQIHDINKVAECYTAEFENCKLSNLIKVRITPTISVVSTKIKYGQPIQFYLKEKNSGNPITGNHYGIIIFNDTYFGDLPDSKGLVSIGQNLPVGFRDLFYFAVMDDKYYSSMMVGNTIEIVA